MVTNPPSNAGDEGLIPDHGTKSPHASGELSHVLQQRPSAKIKIKKINK